MIVGAHLRFPLHHTITIDNPFLLLLLVIALLLYLCLLAVCVVGVAKHGLLLGIAIHTIEEVAHIGDDGNNPFVLERLVVLYIVDVRLVVSLLGLRSLDAFFNRVPLLQEDAATHTSSPYLVVKRVCMHVVLHVEALHMSPQEGAPFFPFGA